MYRTIALLSPVVLTALAFAAAPPVVPVGRPLLSPADQRRASTWQKQSVSRLAAGDLDAAIQLLSQVYQLRRTRQGDGHWQTVDARWELDTVNRLGKRPSGERKAFLATLDDTGRIYRLTQEGSHAEADALARKHVAAYAKTLGKDHPLVAAAGQRVGELLDARGRYFDAAPWHEDALRINLKQFGPDHPQTAGARSRLAASLERRGDFAGALPLHRQAHATALHVFGDSPEEATLLSNVSNNLTKQGRYDEAHALLMRALKTRRDALGEEHADVVQSYSDLAANIRASGDDVLARHLFERALTIRRLLAGDGDASTAQAMGELAACLNAQGHHADAERLYRAALSIEGVRLSDDHPRIARTTADLAATLRLRDDDAEARKLYERALAAWQKSLGENHPRTATGYAGLAECLANEGKHEEAIVLTQQALAIRRRALGDAAPDTLRSFAALAANLSALGEHRRAATLMQHVVAKRVKALGDGHPDVGDALDQLAVFQARAGDFTLAEASAEKAMRLLERTPALLPLLRARDGRALAAWNALERGQTRGLLDVQAAGRTSNDDLRSRRQRVAQLDRQLFVMAEAGEPRSTPLLKRAERARGELAEAEAALAQKYGPAVGAPSSLAAIQATIPDDAAVVGWIDLPAQPRGSVICGEAWACVVRAKGPPTWVRLPGSGKGGEWTAKDDQLPARLRKALADVADWREDAAALYKMRLAPLAKHLKAADDLPAVRRLIALPSVRLLGIPLEVLQEARPDGAPAFVVSYAPSATAFAFLRNKKKSAAAGLLALGDPAFVTTGEGDEKRTRNGLPPLPATRAEVVALAKLGDPAETLLGEDASEEKLERLARGDKLKAFRFIHLATHGYADGERPMQSSLALSDAGLGDPVQNLLRGRPARTGRLTAAQILATWRLDADLVTLSACESGQARHQQGEGFVGFAQALFVAGARSLVLSQWGSSDDATVLLMARFYENLLGKREGLKKPLPRAEALDEARRWLRALSLKEATKLIDALPHGKLVKVPKERTGAKPFAHPYFWAGFVLVGDPG